MLLPKVMVTETLLLSLMCIVFFEDKSSRCLLCHSLMLSFSPTQSINNLLSWGVLQSFRAVSKCCHQVSDLSVMKDGTVSEEQSLLVTLLDNFSPEEKKLI